MELKDFAANQDGSFQVNADGKALRLVKESDLLAVKGASETKAKEWETERSTFNSEKSTYTAKLEESSKSSDTIRQQLLQEQAAKEKLAEQIKDHDALKTKAGELEKQVGSHKELASTYEKELAERITNTLVSYGAKADSLKEKSLTQLRNLEEAARIIGNIKQPKYDNGGGGNGPITETPDARAHRIIEEQEKRQGIAAKVAAK